mgnify:CR=1 FL=1
MIPIFLMPIILVIWVLTRGAGLSAMPRRAAGILMSIGGIALCVAVRFA